MTEVKGDGTFLLTGKSGISNYFCYSTGLLLLLFYWAFIISSNMQEWRCQTRFKLNIYKLA